MKNDLKTCLLDAIGYSTLFTVIYTVKDVLFDNHEFNLENVFEIFILQVISFIIAVSFIRWLFKEVRNK